MTRDARSFTRRAALRLLAAAGLAPLFAVGCREDGAAIREAALGPLLDEPSSMARVGRLWLDGLEQPPVLEALVEALLEGGAGDLPEDRLRQRLAERLRRDWAESRVAEVNGYTLAMTELELYALAERLRERDQSTGQANQGGDG